MAPTIVDSNVSTVAHLDVATAEQVISQKSAKYNFLAETGRLCQLIAAETLDRLNESSTSLF